MKVSNGYVLSKKDGKWRRLPRLVWQRIRWQHAIRLQDQKSKKAPENNNKT